MNAQTAAAVLGAMALVELAGAMALSDGRMSPAAAIALHLALCLTALAAGRYYQRSAMVIGAVAMFAAGPAGALAGALLCLFSTKRHHGSLSAWHRYLSSGPADQNPEPVFTRLASGQALDTSRALPRRFDDILDSGTLRDQQALLGVMAQSYHPCFRAALEKALRSPLAPIRVQAASVYTALRTREALRLSGMGPDLQDGNAQGTALPAIAGLLNSQFLDENERRSVRSRLKYMLDGVAAALETDDPTRAARIRILAEADLLVPAAELVHAGPRSENSAHVR